VRCLDTRGKKRVARITAAAGESRLAELTKTAYVEAGLPVSLYRRKELLGEAKFGHVPDVTEPLHLAEGDLLHLTRSDEPGRPAVCDFNGQLIKPACLPCTLKEAFDAVKPGERIWFDDGKIGGMVTGNDGKIIKVEITHTGVKGGRLRPEKGINLPDTDLQVSALTAKDLEDLRAVVPYADLIGFSFVRTPADVHSLHRHLGRLGAKHITGPGGDGQERRPFTRRGLRRCDERARRVCDAQQRSVHRRDGTVPQRHPREDGRASVEAAHDDAPTFNLRPWLMLAAGTLIITSPRENTKQTKNGAVSSVSSIFVCFVFSWACDDMARRTL
jgi:Pyruvate kinase, barrel domain